MFYSDPSQAFERRFTAIVRNAGPLCSEKLVRRVRGALMSAAALPPLERIGGDEESARRSGANSAGAAAAADSGRQGAGGRTGKLPSRLYSRGGEHGQLHGADKELGTVTVSVLCAEIGSGHEVALFRERVCDVQ